MSYRFGLRPDLVKRGDFSETFAEPKLRSYSFGSAEVSAKVLVENYDLSTDLDES